MKRCSTANVGDVLAVDRQHSGLGENPVIVRVYIYIFYYVGCVGGLLQFFFFLPLSPYQLFTLIPFTPFFYIPPNRQHKGKFLQIPSSAMDLTANITANTSPT
jgi:hypothetical protein